VGDVDQVIVEVRGHVGRRTVGGLGDPAGPPGGESAGEEPGPDPGQPVPQLEGVVDQSGAGVRGHPERGGQRRGRIPGEVGQVLVVQGTRRPGTVGARQHRVQVRPLGRRNQDRGLGRVGGAP